MEGFCFPSKSTFYRPFQLPSGVFPNSYNSAFPSSFSSLSPSSLSSNLFIFVLLHDLLPYMYRTCSFFSLLVIIKRTRSLVFNALLSFYLSYLLFLFLFCPLILIDSPAVYQQCYLCQLILLRLVQPRSSLLLVPLALSLSRLGSES